MIKELTPNDINDIYAIINRAAIAYRGAIPNDCYHKPYMPLEELRNEMGRMTFFGWEEGNGLIGVIGFQPIKDVTLIRHAYVLPDHQRKGIGAILLHHVRQKTDTRQLLVGTWKDASWAIKFYQKHGFVLMPHKDELLKRYWNIPRRQIDTSVVLGIALLEGGHS
jgi:GNAT superfamily N-acetyltransferase